MSYDIFCYKSNLKHPDIDDASQVIEDDNDIWVKKPYNYEMKIAVEKALLGIDPALIGFDYDLLAKKKNKSAEDVKKEFLKFELNAAYGESEVHVEVFDYHVAIAVPFIYQGDIAKTVFEKLKLYIKVVNETAGYFVYDPQTGQVFDPAENEFDGLNKYLLVSESTEEMIGAQSTAQTKITRPWWKFW